MIEQKISLADVKDTKGYFAKVREGVDYLKQCGETTCTSPNNIRKLIISPSFMAAAYYVDSPVHAVYFYDMTQDQLIDFLCNGSNTNDFLSLFVKTPVCDNIEEILYCYPDLLSGVAGKVDAYFPDHSYDASATINHFKRLQHFVYVEIDVGLAKTTNIASSIAYYLSKIDKHEENYTAFDKNLLKDLKHEFKKENPDYLYNKGLTPVSISTYSLEDKNGGALFVRMNRLVQIALVARAKKTKETQEAQEDKSKPSVTETILKPALAYAINLRNTIFEVKIGTTVEDKAYKFDMTESANANGTYDEFLFTDNSYSEIIHDYDEMSVKIRKLTEGYNNGGSLCIFSSSYDFSDEAVAYDLFTTWFTKAGGNGSNFFQMLNYFCSCLTVVSLMTELDNGDGTYDLVVETAYAKLKGSKFFKGQANNPIKLEGKYDNKFDEDVGDFKGFVATRYYDTVNPEDVEEEEEEFPEESEYAEENQFPDDEEFDEDDYIEEDTVTDEDYDSEDEYDEDDYIDEDTDDGSDAFDNSENEDDAEAFIDEGVDTQEEPNEEPIEEELKKEEPKPEVTEEDINTEDKLIDAMLKNMTIKSYAEMLDSIADKLMEFYSGNFTGIPHAGLLVPNPDSNSNVCPLYKCKVSTKAIETTSCNDRDTGTAKDLIISRVLAKNIKSLSTIAMSDRSQKTGFPTYAQLKASPCYLLEAQLMFQTANIALSGNFGAKNSITHFNTLENAGIDTKKARIMNKKTIKRWYKWVLQRQYCRYILEVLGESNVKMLLGVDEGEWTKVANTMQQIATVFSKSLCNVVAVVEREIDTDGKICSTKIATLCEVDYNAVSSQLQSPSGLNITGKMPIKVEGSESNGIVSFRISYTGKIGGTPIYSGNIVKELVAAGIIPTWDNVILGRDENGDLIYKNLYPKEDADSTEYVYAIYGGAGSGKGNMTLNLLAAAICSGLRIFYTDGKPDSGYSLGMEAWKDGVEAAIFDGQPICKVEPFNNGSLLAEELPVLNKVRTTAEVLSSASGIPKGLCDSVFAMQTLLGVTRYIRMIEFWKKSITQHPKDKWAVYVFDEVSNMNTQELYVRNMFTTYIRKKLAPLGLKDTSFEFKQIFDVGTSYDALMSIPDSFVTKAPKASKEAAQQLDEDPGIKYIRAWLEWSEKATDGLSDFLKISARQCHAITFMIFQQADWFPPVKNVTTMGKFAGALGTICTKFVGRNALVKNCDSFGQASAVHSDWYQKYVYPEAYWALCGSAVTGDSSHVLTFKPFSCWGFMKDPGGNTLAPEVTEDPVTQRYFHYYLSNVAQALGVSPSAVLHDAYEFACSFITQANGFDLLGGNLDSFKQFVYNASIFGGKSANDDSIEDALNAIRNRAGNSQFTEQPVEESVNSQQSSSGQQKQQTGQPVPKKAAPNMTVSNKVISFYAKQMVLNKVKAGVKLPKPKEVLMRALYDATMKALISKGYKIVK